MDDVQDFGRTKSWALRAESEKELEVATGNGTGSSTWGQVLGYYLVLFLVFGLFLGLLGIIWMICSTVYGDL